MFNYLKGSFLTCQQPHSGDKCKLNVVCLNPSCEKRGLICYLCAFSDPHAMNCSDFIVPLRLIQTSSSHQTPSPHLKDVQDKVDQHLQGIHTIKTKFLSILENYENKIKKAAEPLKTVSPDPKQNLLSILEMQKFKDEKELQLFISDSINFITKTGQGEYIFHQENSPDLSIEQHIKTYLKAQNSAMKKAEDSLISLVSDLVLLMGSESDKYKANFIQLPPPVSFVTFASLPDPTLQEKNKVVSETKPEQNQPKTEIDQWIVCHETEIIVQKEPEQNQPKSSSPPKPENNIPEIELPQHPSYEIEIAPALVKKQNSNISLNEDQESPQESPQELADQENTESDKVVVSYSSMGNIDSKKTSTSALNDVLLETSGRFENTKCSNYIYVLKKPEKRIDAVAFYAKDPGVSLQGFGFYCPNSFKESSVKMECLVYEGMHSDAKLLLCEKILLQGEKGSLQPKGDIGRILLKTPVKLVQERYYTIVLHYIDEVSIMYGEGKWLNVGPFMFAGISKNTLFHWLNLQSAPNQTDLLYSWQFPYLIYSVNNSITSTIGNLL